MAAFADRLRTELEAVPVIDPHTHLRPDHPEAADLADIVLYHHVWVELVSAGMPATATTQAGLPHELADPGMDPKARVAAALPFLHLIRNTTCGGFLRTLLQDLYGVPGGELTAANLDAVWDAVAQRAADPAWREQVLRERCHIETSLTVEKGDVPAGPGIARGIEFSFNLASGKQGPRETLLALERRLGRDIQTADDLEAGAHALGKDFSSRGLRFVGLWLLPFQSYCTPTGWQVTRVIRQVRDGKAVSHTELSEFTCHALRHFLLGLREGSLRTLQVIVGAEVLPPHRSLTDWSPEYPGMLGRLAGEFEDFHFNCSTASDLYTQDLGILAKHVPNISVAGYWWHTLYPHYIRKSLETRLDMVPSNKIVGFFSDAYHAEWCYPKLRLVKQTLGEVLAERVEQGWYSEEIALSLVREVMYENAKRIYGV